MKMRKILGWIGKIVLIVWLLSILTVVAYRFIPVYVTPLMVMRATGQLLDGEKITWKHKWVPLKDISPKLVQAVVASEDNLFPEHHGFDIQQIKKALDERKTGKRKRGASTISQQTAKNVFLLPVNSFIRKGFEAYFTVLIEWIWGKERIMEVYLNSIEMGNGIYGAEKAAELYFSKSAKQLTAGEAALIAGSLPNPLKFNPGKPSPYLRKRQGDILGLMEKIGTIQFDTPKKR